MYKEMDNGYIPSVFQEKQIFTKEDFLDEKTFQIGNNYEKVYSLYKGEDFQEITNQYGDKEADIIKITKTYFTFEAHVLGQQVRRKIFFSDCKHAQ
jgi:hypothetical protein